MSKTLLKKLVATLLLLSLAVSQSFCGGYFITEEQKAQLEKNLKIRDEKINELSMQLATQEILISEMEKQLNQAEESAKNSENSRKKTEQYLNRLKNRELVHSLLIFTASFSAGLLIGLCSKL